MTRAFVSTCLAPLTLVLAMLATLAGCASFNGAPTWNPATTLKEADPLYAGYIERYYRARTPASRQTIRNEFIEVRAGMVDRAYASFKESIYAQRVGSAVGVDVATLTLNAIGAAVSDVGTKTGTSALSAGLIGSKSSIDKNVYFDRTLPALLAQMDGARSQVRTRILAGMLVDVERYPLMQAASDLDAYFHAGTLTGAIAGITNQASAAQSAAEATLRDRLPKDEDVRARLKARGFSIESASQSATAKKVEMCLQDDGTLKPGVEEPLKTWLNKQPDAPKGTPTPLSDFMVRNEFEALRAKAMADPELGKTFDKCMD